MIPAYNCTVERAISNILEKNYQIYLSPKRLTTFLLRGSSYDKTTIRLANELYYSALTSLQFGQYRRAVWYTKAFCLLCKNRLGKSRLEQKSKLLQQKFLLVENGKKEMET